MAGGGGRRGPLAKSKRGRVWRRAGLELEATPGPPLPQAQPRTTGLRGASSSPFLSSAALQILGRPKARACRNPWLTDARRALLPVGGGGLCQILDALDQLF